jgi:hypothetical protein
MADCSTHPGRGSASAGACPDPLAHGRDRGRARTCPRPLGLPHASATPRRRSTTPLQVYPILLTLNLGTGVRSRTAATAAGVYAACAARLRAARRAAGPTCSCRMSSTEGRCRRKLSFRWAEFWMYSAECTCGAAGYTAQRPRLRHRPKCSKSLGPGSPSPQRLHVLMTSVQRAHLEQLGQTRTDQPI